MSDKKKEMNPYEIAVIGYTQAGKTVLAVGLYATASAEFAVTGKGEETVNYLQMRKAILESGEWVDATQEGERLNLQLVINRRGKKPAEVVFQEYMGERASVNPEAYKREVIGNPRAAMILMNPKMEILRDAGRRNEMIGQIKDIISYLSGPGMRCEHIAFVVTAADLLTTSLKDYKDEFDGYKEEITNCLNTNPKFQNAWKEFEVTVTGPLEDPEHPRIARADGNTSRKPFEWLIEQIDNVGTKGRLAKLGHWIVTLLLFGGLAFSSWYFYFDRAAERALDGVLASPGGARREVAFRSALERREPFFERNKKPYTKKKNEIEILIDTERLKWFHERMDSLRNEISNLDSSEGIDDNVYEGKKKELEDFGQKLKEHQAKTEANKEQLRILQGEWENEESELIGALDDWRQRYEDKQFVDGNQKVMTELANAALDFNDGTKINAALLGCKDYEMWAMDEDAKPRINFKIRKETWNIIKKEKIRLLAALLDNQIGLLKSDGAEPPCISEEDKVFLQQTLRTNGALSEEDYGVWTNMLNEGVISKYAEWEKIQGKKCEKAIKEIEGCTVAIEALKKYQDCCSNNPKAPQLDRVAEAANHVVMSEFRQIYEATASYVDDHGARYDTQMMQSRSKEMQKTYGQLKTLVNKVLRVGDSGCCASFKETGAYKFAEGCKTKGIVPSAGTSDEFQQEYKIKTIEVKIDYDNSEGWTGDFPVKFDYVSFNVSGITFDGLNSSFISRPIVSRIDLHKEDNHKWMTIFSGATTIKGSPWEDAFLAVKVTEANKATWKKSEELLRLKMLWGENTQSTYEGTFEFNTGRKSGDSSPEVHIKIHLEGSGIEFFAFAESYLFKGGK